MRVIAVNPSEAHRESAAFLGIDLEQVSSLDEIDTSEPTWVLPEGYSLVPHAFQALQGYVADGNERVAYGDTAYPDRLHRRPRFRPMTMASTTDIGSILCPTGVHRPSSIADLLTDDMVHLPVTLDRADSAPQTVIRPRWRVAGDYAEPEPVTRPVSVIIPSIGSQLDDGRVALLVCLASLPTVAEIIVVAGPAMPTEVRTQVEDLDPGVTIVDIDGSFNFSASCNLGAAHASSDMVLFLNDDIECPATDWLGVMCATHEMTGGPVGIRLLFDDGRIQHAGIVIDPEKNEPNHLYYKADPGEVTDPVTHCVAEFLAVTGAALLIDKVSFEEVGGFSLDLPVNYNDVDLCLKLATRGKPATCVNTQSLIHRESTSRTPIIEEFETRAMDAWGPLTVTDPCTYAWWK